MSEISNENLTRIGMACVGALAGGSVWVLMDVLPQSIENQWLLLWIGSVIFGFFTPLLGLVGPLKPREALSVAAVLGLSAAALFYWASLRVTDVDDVFEIGFDPAAFCVLIFMGAPFGAAVMRGRVFDYAFLFDTAWGIVVRYLAAWVFVGLFWAALFLSHALLEIVGITLIWDLVEEDVVPFVLTGLVLGLALAVANELRAYVSPYLLLRLLRLLMPPLVLVVGVFILALPFRGLSGLFGEFSAAGTLMAVAIAGASLIAAAVDSTDEEAVGSRLMHLATKAFAGMLPILGVLAVWAVVIRVSDYGWTPVRLAAFVAAVFVLAYGVLYGAALLRSDWMARIRQANVYHALAVLLVAALWLSPVLDTSRISANSQVKRLVTGVSTVENLPAWEIVNEWGWAGQRALERLKALDETEYPGLGDVLLRAENDSKWEFNRSESGPTRLSMATEALEKAILYPEGASLTPSALAGLRRIPLERLVESCGVGPCVLILGEMGEGRQIVSFIPQFEGGADVALYGENDGVYFYDQYLTQVDQATLEKVAAGEFRVAPSSLKSIWIGEMEIGAGRLGRQFIVQPLK
ncbi:hypothetical protein WG622_05390 [Cognatishimia sp. D5M38]|uniref:DUF4153 domain-containing protein n=1 Tax=Cognatishimia coralii TaxID=3083254 RepID=A0ABU8QE09_9RHOB